MLRQTATLQRPTNVQVSGGTKPSGWTDVVSDFRCSIQTFSPTKDDKFARRGVEITTKIYTNVDIGAKLGDRIVDGRYSPAVYYIVHEVEDMGARGQVWGLFCTKIKG